MDDCYPQCRDSVCILRLHTVQTLIPNKGNKDSLQAAWIQYAPESPK